MSPASPLRATTQVNGPSPQIPTATRRDRMRALQFFASKINTIGSGSQSMLYSTYFGGGYPKSGQTQGGGIAVDTTGNMYITGGTNFLETTGPNGEAQFPLNLAQQGCLDEASKTQCNLTNPTALDAFVAKITPKPGFTLPVYSTYLGGRLSTSAMASRSIPPAMPTSPAQPSRAIGFVPAARLASRVPMAWQATPSSPKSAT